MEIPATSVFKLSETVTCPDCKHEIILYDYPKSKFASCSVCHVYWQIVATGVLKQRKQLEEPKKEPALKLGTTVQLHGDTLKVIAYLEKKESNTVYSWREYLLSSSDKGYVTLSEFNGHWNFIAGEKFLPDYKKPMSYGDSIDYKGVLYKLFNKYTPVVTAMLGEADWDVIGERVKASEYIAPPFMVVQETNRNNVGERNYYIGEYLEPEYIANAFGINRELLPEKIDIGANEPSKAYQNWTSALVASGVALIIILLIHILLGYAKPEKELINDTFLITYDGSSGTDTFKPFVTPAFTIDDESSNLAFEIASAVDNNWLEATIMLVNEIDNKTWEVSKGIEYYHGYEDGEKWSEGSTTQSILISEIPKGKYHLNVYPSSGDIYRNSLYIKATCNVPLWRNTLISILLICIYPTIAWYLMRNYEKKRWNNSDYSPFVTED
ncbi:DUF4178 domain-containing protein [Pedobacter sandarakinus]|uniref:DUF4178 domain-containing protein n=1 Tax=Pedobacter sandarakinus TaxID=353156 RepID=UPI002246828D|nr:DUF4178 domain-containing protein [Pedobacter sandarakinus]MCX2575478.1 DUF4178 domain-containing protein [Pedobacter sandarakinus]